MHNLTHEAFEIRPIQRGICGADLDFIFGTWLGSFKRHAACGGVAYDRGQRRLIDRLINASDARVVVTCSSEDPDTILAWGCGDSEYLHYIHVKPLARGQGLANDVIHSLGFSLDTLRYSHTTRVWSLIMAKYKDSFFNPYHLME